MTPNNTQSPFLEKFKVYFKAAQPYLYCETHEENLLQSEVLNYFFDNADGRGRKATVYGWDEMRGVLKYKGKTSVEELGNANPAEFIAWYTALNKSENVNEHRSVVIVKGFHPYLKLSKSIRTILNCAQPSKQRSNMLVFVSPRFEIPYELETQLVNIDFPLPGVDVLAGRLEVVRSSYTNLLKDTVAIEPRIHHAAVEAARGLTYYQAEDAFTVASISTGGKFNDDFVSAVFLEKISAIKKTGLLSYMKPDSSFDDLGGLADLKNWLKVRSIAFTKEAKEYGIPYPKGVLLASPPGCGKSQTAKALSKEWNTPCFQLDIGSLFNGTVGSTEANFRAVLRIVDAVGKCILFIDEAEKSLNVDAVAGRGDTGTSSRSFASLLTWMEDHTTPVFVVMTSNNFTILPPELIRKGRLSELFWIDIPDIEERKDIWKVIIQRYGRDAQKFDLVALSKDSDKFTGSEIKDAFVSAMTNAFFIDKEVDQEQVAKVLADSKPQADVNRAELDLMREKSKDKLRSAKGVAVMTTSKEFRLIQH